MSRSLIFATFLPLLASALAFGSGETITVTTLHDVRDFGGSQRVGEVLHSEHDARQLSPARPGKQRDCRTKAEQNQGDGQTSKAGGQPVLTQGRPLARCRRGGG